MSFVFALTYYKSDIFQKTDDFIDICLRLQLKLKNHKHNSRSITFTCAAMEPETDCLRVKEANLHDCPDASKLIYALLESCK